MTSPRSHLRVAFALKNFHHLCTVKCGRLWHTLDRNQMEAHVLVFHRRSFFIFKTQKCCFFDVRKSLFYSLALTVATLKSEVGYRVSALLFLLQNYRIRTVLHMGMVPQTLPYFCAD